jgi:hypothetical protein
MKMDVACPPETLVRVYKTIRQQIPEGNSKINLKVIPNGLTSR